MTYHPVGVKPGRKLRPGLTIAALMRDLAAEAIARGYDQPVQGPPAPICSRGPAITVTRESPFSDRVPRVDVSREIVVSYEEPLVSDDGEMRELVQRIVRHFADDKTGIESEDVRTRHFSFGGRDYEMDMSEETYAEFLDAVQGFMPPVSRVRRSRPAPKRDVRAKRRWLQEQGYMVADHGRLARTAEKAYDEAHGLAS